MATGIMALLAALFAAIPAILNVIEGAKARQRKDANAITQRDMDELERGMAAVDGVSADKPLPPGGQTGL